MSSESDPDLTFYECDSCTFKSVIKRRCPRCGGRIGSTA